MTDEELIERLERILRKRMGAHLDNHSVLNGYNRQDQKEAEDDVSVVRSFLRVLTGNTWY